MDNKKIESGENHKSLKDKYKENDKSLKDKYVELSKLLGQIQSSPLPWSCGENANSTWFIYDKNSHIVADEIRNKGDAALIVIAVNYFGSLR